MILVDYSSILHRMIHYSISQIKPKKNSDGQYITSEFIGLTKHNIISNLFSVKQEFGNKFGDMVICLDQSRGGYWRSDVWPSYKATRKTDRAKSPIVFQEVFSELDKFTDQMINNLPWKTLAVPRAEADDIMLVLASEFHNSDNILIHSPDKDMIQAQRNPNVSQYSSLTKKWLTGTSKSSDMDRWIHEHCILGDVSDNVPKVVDGTEFTDTFREHLLNNKRISITTPMDFRFLDTNIQRDLIESFDVMRTNRLNESTGVKDIFKKIRFGPKTLIKMEELHGSVDNWLDSNPLYREHYNRNFTLVMEEGIPDYIREAILDDFKTASVEYNAVEFEQYLKDNGLSSIILELSGVFPIQRELNASDFGW